MGVIMKNKVNYTGGGSGGGGNANEMTLTMAEYLALTEEQRMDGTTYYITDGVSPQNASAKYTEKELWSGTQSSTGSLTLNESIESYQMIIFIYTAQSGNGMEGSSVRLVSDVVYGRSYHFTFSEFVVSDLNYYFSGHFDDATTFTIDERGNTGRAAVTLKKIIGIKWETMRAIQIYSEQERQIGVWIDNKPLYQKTINCGLVANETSAHDIAHNISNIEKCISCNALLIKNDEEHFANAYRPTQTMGVLVWRSGANIRYINNWLGANEYRLYVTIQYTKTTDTAGGATWTTDGAPTVHYDGNEKVIGTWFGETLYEKSYHLANASNTTYILEQTFQATLVDATGSWTDSSGYRRPIPYEYINLDVFVYSYNNQLKLQFAPSNATDVYITIRYTKSS